MKHVRLNSVSEDVSATEGVAPAGGQLAAVAGQGEAAAPKQPPAPALRLFSATAGAADLIASYRHWLEGSNNPTEVSMTFSGQAHDYCRDIGAQGYFVSTHPSGERVEDGAFVIEHRPKPARTGLGFHFEELRYCLGLLRTARNFRADVALLDSGVTHYFLMALFRLFGIPVVPILHNTLWAKGFRPRDPVQWIILQFDKLFWRRVPFAVVAVSPEVERQVEALAPDHRYPIHQIRAQFRSTFFDAIPPAPPHTQRPFQVQFTGRIHESKGALDIPRMARRIEDRRPGLVRWVICGGGPDLDALRNTIAEQGVEDVVDVRGWVPMEELQQVYADSHVAIVPTRSTFAEGLAMTAAEAILAERPLVTNPIVPALELLAPAALGARSNDPDSHADAVERLATDPALYEQLRQACADLQPPFYDRSRGLRAVLHRVLEPLQREAVVKSVP